MGRPPLHLDRIQLSDLTPAQQVGMAATYAPDDVTAGTLTWAGRSDPELALVNGRTAQVLHDLGLVRCERNPACDSNRLVFRTLLGAAVWEEATSDG